MRGIPVKGTGENWGGGAGLGLLLRTEQSAAGQILS